MDAMEILPGDQRRKQILSVRLKAIREALGLRQADMERIAPELTEARVRQWETVSHIKARPRATSFVILSETFGYPFEYFWPPLPEDGYSGFDVDGLFNEIHELGNKIRHGDATPEELERYQHLLFVESKLASRRNIYEFTRPPLHLVCVIRKLPADPEDLPRSTDAWEGAWVMPVPGVAKGEQVYAYELPSDCGMPAGTVVLFRPIFDGKPSKERWTIGNRRGVPIVFRESQAPDGTTVIGEVMLALFEPKK